MKNALQALVNRPRFTALIAGLLGSFLYVGTIGYSYVLDDFDLIVDNYLVKQGLDALDELWVSEVRQGYWGKGGSLYRPLTATVFAIEWHFWPGNPQVAHLISVVLYGLCCAMFALWAMALTTRLNMPMAGLAAVLLFVLHPIHTEVVCNIKSTDELLAFAFGFVMLIALHRCAVRFSWLHLVLAGVCFFMALAAKESSITLVVFAPFLLAYVYKLPLKPVLQICAALAVPVLCYLALRYHALGQYFVATRVNEFDNMLVGLHGAERIATNVKILGLYLAKLLYPHVLSHDYSIAQIEPVDLTHPWVLLTLAVLAVLAVVAWRLRRSLPVFTTGIVLLAITGSMFSNVLITIGTHFGERLMFLPSSGYALAAGAIFVWAGQRLRQYRWFIVMIFCMLCVVYFAKTKVRSQDWKDEITLFEADVINAPNSARTHYRLGRAYTKYFVIENEKTNQLKWLMKAEAELKKSIDLYPQYADAYSELGLVYQKRKEYSKALKAYDQAIALNPTHFTAIHNKGAVYYEQAMYGSAIPLFKLSVEINPAYLNGYMSLGSACGMVGDYTESIEWFKKAIELDPYNAKAHYFIALNYQNMGDREESNRWAERAFELDPSLRQ
ncbi:MAG: hypothetical protein Kow0075_16250 [Salibacteraceae bacterium]